MVSEQLFIVQNLSKARHYDRPGGFSSRHVAIQPQFKHAPGLKECVLEQQIPAISFAGQDWARRAHSRHLLRKREENLRAAFFQFELDLADRLFFRFSLDHSLIQRDLNPGLLVVDEPCLPLDLRFKQRLEIFSNFPLLEQSFRRCSGGSCAARREARYFFLPFASRETNAIRLDCLDMARPIGAHARRKD